MTRGEVAEVLHKIALTVGKEALVQVVAPVPGRAAVRWQELFGGARAQRTLQQHAVAVSAPQRLAGVLVAGQLVAALAKLQAWALMATGQAFDITPEDLLVAQEDDGRTARRVGLDAARVVVATGAETAAAKSLDQLLERCGTEFGIIGRVPVRVLACNAAFAWLAALRAGEGRAGLPTGGSQALLRTQWRARWPLTGLVREFLVPAPDGTPHLFLGRSVCCLEYHCDIDGPRTYCHTCPLVPADSIIARRAAVERGERPPPFGERDLRNANRRRAAG